MNFFLPLLEVFIEVSEYSVDGKICYDASQYPYNCYGQAQARLTLFHQAETYGQKLMGKKKKQQQTATHHPPVKQDAKQWFAIGAMIVMLGVASALFYRTFSNNKKSGKVAAGLQPNVTASAAPPAASSDPNKMNIAQAVMVTEELDFGQPVPTIAQALNEIERGYAPDDGQGRTFAVLDAYGEPTPDGKLHISMHVSSEKPGTGFLRFKRTGKILWQARIGNPGDPPAGGKSLMIYLDNGAGGSLVLDGTRGGASVLDVFLKDSQQKVRDVWPDQAVREFTYVYSACGCPVKVMVRRVGERTARVKDTPVIFPDDPDAGRTIAQLMKW
jgi:hypothetical protein